MKNIINQQLRQLGITANYRGFRQLVIAIALVTEDEDRLFSMQKEVYSPVAAALHCSDESVERNIRTAINRMWHTNRERYFQIIGYEISTQPTATEFIDAIANAVRCSTH